MNNISGLSLYEKFLEYLFSTSEITVPTEFHDRCNKIREMLDDDVSGVINSLLDYSVNSASEAIFRVECTEPTLQRLLNMWLQGVNLDIPGIPTGLQALSKEYYKERWAGSSFCVLSIRGWEPIEIDNVEIQVPQVMW